MGPRGHRIAFGEEVHSVRNLASTGSSGDRTLFSLEDARRMVLDGVVCRVEKRLPFLLSYEIMCDEKWGTKKVNLNQSVGGVMRKLVLRVDNNQRWWTGSRELYKLRAV